MRAVYLLVGLGCGIVFAGAIVSLFNYGWTPLPACLLVASSVMFGMSYGTAMMQDKY